MNSEQIKETIRQFMFYFLSARNWVDAGLRRNNRTSLLSRMKARGMNLEGLRKLPMSTDADFLVMQKYLPSVEKMQEYLTRTETKK